jgi:hypothetical protein
LEAAHAIAQKSAEAEMAARLKRVIQVHLYVDVSECLLARCVHDTHVLRMILNLWKRSITHQTPHAA